MAFIIEDKKKLWEIKTLYVPKFIFLGLSVTLLTTVVLSSYILLSTAYLESQKKLVIIEVDTSQSLRYVSKSFLSVALDSSLFRNERMQKLIRSGELYKFTLPLSPAYLRVGGTASDLLFFDPNEWSVESANIFYDNPCDSVNCEEIEEHNLDNITMTGDSWLLLNQFSKNSSLDLVFDLNVLIRFNNSWDSTNAEEILKYSEGIACNITWQLGNEPNSFRHVFGISVPAAQLGVDFINLRSLLDKYPSCYKNSLLTGPDVTNPELNLTPSQDYLHQFLQNAKTSINAVSWHHYYFNGRTATLNDFLNPQIFDQLKDSINIIQSIVQKVEPNIPLWLSETSSAWGGGAPGLSDRYAASFIWLDKLGLGAQLGLDVVVRQTLCGGSYALVDCKTFQPNPDWWVSVLYKKLVGEVVLNAKYSPEESVRLYAHCSPSGNGSSSIVIFGMNLEDKSINLKTKGLTGKGFLYILNTASDLYTRSVMLNRKTLELKPDHTLPTFEPTTVSLNEVIEIPSLAIVFLVTQKQYSYLCKKNFNNYFVK